MCHTTIKTLLQRRHIKSKSALFLQSKNMIQHWPERFPVSGGQTCEGDIVANPMWSLCGINN